MLTLERLRNPTDAECAGFDLAAVDLACAVGLQGSEQIDIPACLAWVDYAAAWARHQTVATVDQFRRSPETYENSEGIFRVVAMMNVLWRGLGVHYNHPTNATDPTGESENPLSDYWYYLWNPGSMDPGLQTGQKVALGTAAVCGATAGGLALGGVNIVLWGGGAAAGGATLGVGTTAVVGPGLGAGTWPALLIVGVVYVHRFHVLAAELAGGAASCGPVQKYGMAIIDATGKVIGWVGQ